MHTTKKKSLAAPERRLQTRAELVFTIVSIPFVKTLCSWSLFLHQGSFDHGRHACQWRAFCKVIRDGRNSSIDAPKVLSIHPHLLHSSIMAEETFSTTPSMSLMNGKAPAGANTSPDNHRSLGRSSTFAHVTNSLTRRRGSVLSDSLDETRQSIRSSTDNLLLPRPIDPHLISTGEHSHWHSAPLVLALLPALGGLFFTNGSALITDLTLLGLAAIFLNWSVKLPW